MIQIKQLILLICSLDILFLTWAQEEAPVITEQIENPNTQQQEENVIIGYPNIEFSIKEENQKFNNQTYQTNENSTDEDLYTDNQLHKSQLQWKFQDIFFRLNADLRLFQNNIQHLLSPTYLHSRIYTSWKIYVPHKDIICVKRRNYLGVILNLTSFQQIDFRAIAIECQINSEELVDFISSHFPFRGFTHLANETIGYYSLNQNMVHLYLFNKDSQKPTEYDHNCQKWIFDVECIKGQSVIETAGQEIPDAKQCEKHCSNRMDLQFNHLYCHPCSYQEYHEILEKEKNIDHNNLSFLISLNIQDIFFKLTSQTQIVMELIYITYCILVNIRYKSDLLQANLIIMNVIILIYQQFNITDYAMFVVFAVAFYQSWKRSKIFTLFMYSFQLTVVTFKLLIASEPSRALAILSSNAFMIWGLLIIFLLFFCDNQSKLFISVIAIRSYSKYLGLLAELSKYMSNDNRLPFNLMQLIYIIPEQDLYSFDKIKGRIWTVLISRQILTFPYRKEIGIALGILVYVFITYAAYRIGRKCINQNIKGKLQRIFYAITAFSFSPIQTILALLKTTLGEYDNNISYQCFYNTSIYFIFHSLFFPDVTYYFMGWSVLILPLFFKILRERIFNLDMDTTVFKGIMPSFQAFREKMRRNRQPIISKKKLKGNSEQKKKK